MRPGDPNKQLASCFKEYCHCQSSQESNPRTKQAATSIITLVNGALNKAKQIKGAIEKNGSGTKRTLIPATTVEHIKIVCSAVVSANVCLLNGAQTLLETTPALADILREGEQQARALQETATTIAVFIPISEAKRRNKIAKIRMRVDALTQTLNTAYQELEQFIDVTPVEDPPAEEPKNKNQPEVSAEQRLLESLNPEYLEPFLEIARDRGWRIHDKPSSQNIETAEEHDGFLLSIELVQASKRNEADLLQSDQMIGIVEFPVIVVNKRTIPDQIIQTCVDPCIGYSVYLVFGGYVVVKNMLMIGIHESILQVYDSDTINQSQLATEKFAHFLPYVSSQEPIWAPTLEKLQPIQPIRHMGAHYYSPLMPRTVSNDWNGSLGDWAFLVQ